MLFGAKLANEAYAPWKSHYINYEHLKKLLKESVISDKESWTEEDESRFVQELDKELEKVYSYEARKYTEISNKLSNIEKKTENLTEDTELDPKEVELQLESLLEETTNLDKFRRLNYTGFSKIVKKHDRIHPRYQVRPLFKVRLNAQSMLSEDYSPLLYRLSNLYKVLYESLGAELSKSALSLSENRSNEYVTLQYWVHPENLMEVKTRILRRLPLLVYNREDDDEELGQDPVVTSLYLDSPRFDLYRSQLEKKNSDLGTPTSLRFRWYGDLYRSPEIVLEQHNEEDGKITRISLKEKTIGKFLEANPQVIDKQVQKLKFRKAPESSIREFQESAKELQKFIKDYNLQPMLRTIYKRSAFEIPGDDHVRVILDSNIMFIKEDSLDEQHPIRDPNQWHRADLDSPNVQLQSILRKGEYAHFGYSVLEVRLRTKTSQDNRITPERPSWMEELVTSGLIKQVPQFTKYLQGLATLYCEDERMDTLPFWLNDSDPNIKAQGSSGGEPQPPQAAQPRVLHDYDFGDDDQGSDDSDDAEIEGAEEGSSAGDTGTKKIGFPTWVNNGPKLADMDSEDEEISLPAGVRRPTTWLKNQNSIKVEAKVWLANERTFNRWLHVTCLLSAFTFTIYSSVEKTTSPAVATTVAYVLFALTLFTGLWGYYQYLYRLEHIRAREDAHLDNPFGPIVVAIGLLFVLCFNFFSHFKAHVLETVN